MVRKFFGLDHFNTTVRREFIAGATTFATMVYIVIVNPKILEAAGIPFGPSMVATILTAFVGTLTMGVYAKRPFAIAPYMGENAFIAYTVVKVLGYTWQTAIGAIFISGVIFVIITLCGLRKWLANAIPEGLRVGFAVGIGLFLTFIGMTTTGIVRMGVPSAPVHVGNFEHPTVLLSIAGFLFIAFLMMKRVTGAILIGILTITGIAFITGLAATPETIVSLPPDPTPTMLHLDIQGAFTWGFLAVVLTVVVMDFVDTIGSLLGVSEKAGFLDQNGNLPNIERPMLCDATATVFASLVGTTSSGVYIESAAGIEAGGKTGLASVFTAILFLLTLFFAPLFTSIPPCAYGPALIIVGMLTLSPIARLNFEDLTEIVPVFLVITLMSFTYNIGIGMTAAFVVYPVMKTLAGRYKEVTSGLWVLFVMSIVFYVFYPY
jgi:AGZA family xanthine/uracil permease-like MFS transporter